ncbi:ribosomal RNA adenine methyltransferase KsgA/Erm [Kipferlia bialata]|uniref:rRNA adenine N(6)-methyltransferase n=1 Tax=Kipferlia bialata TaxID=797122 RepID=A0A9K3GGL4_9EUKA|nr:ribosomal RNA adenine methyltransferase KsgA/Erm [Kipferlia bialata]|eukprot:g2705.t1
MCISNCPYNISSAIVFRLLEIGGWRRSVLMFQKEFAQGLCAQPGDDQYSRISVNTQMLAKTQHLLKVSRNSFRPPPKVDSSVIMLEPLPPRPNLDVNEWDSFVKTVFNRKHRTLGAIFKNKSVLATLAELPSNAAVKDRIKEIVTQTLEAKTITLCRSGHMKVEELLSTMMALREAGIHFL